MTRDVYSVSSTYLVFGDFFNTTVILTAIKQTATRYTTNFATRSTTSLSMDNTIIFFTRGLLGDDLIN